MTTAADASQNAGRRRLISVVTPCFNEEANVGECYCRVKAVFEKELPEYDSEHVFADNASTDGTAAILRELAAADRRVKVIVNSRNFGPFASVFNAVTRTRGDAVVAMVPADMQDPPEVIPQMVRQWEKGFQVVGGRRKKRGEGFFITLMRRAFYRIADLVSYVSVPTGVGEFQLIDRVIVDELRRHHDYYPFVRGMIAECGFDRAIVEYAWQPRKKGKSTHGFIRYFDQAMNGIVSLSNAPLRLATVVGGAVAGLSLLTAVGHFLINLLFYRVFAPPGMATVVVAIFFLGGVQLIFLGILGEYIGAIHAQVRKRGNVIERELVNFDSEA